MTMSPPNGIISYGPNPKGLEGNYRPGRK